MQANIDNSNMGIVPLNDLDNNINDIAKQIVNESDVDTTKDLVQLFNWNLSKKNAIRLLKLNGLYDKITDQMIERFQKRSGEFSNNDLLNYLQTIENSIERTQKDLISSDTATPTINVQNNTQVNFNVLDSFDSDSKSRITDAIKEILAQSAQAEEKPIEFYTDDISDEPSEENN